MISIYVIKSGISHQKHVPINKWTCGVLSETIDSLSRHGHLEIIQAWNLQTGLVPQDKDKITDPEQLSGLLKNMKMESELQIPIYK